MARSDGAGAARVSAALEATGMNLTEAQSGFLETLIAENGGNVNRSRLAREISDAQEAGVRLTTRRLRTLVEDNAT